MTRLISVPRVPWRDRLPRRTAARNALGSVLRAVKQGRCERAQRIVRDYDFQRAVEGIPLKTMRRIYDKIDACFDSRGDE